MPTYLRNTFEPRLMLKRNGGITMNDNGKKEWQDSYYVCPVCKQPLTSTINGLFCQRDGIEYPVKNAIPDFIADDLAESTSPF